MKATLIALAIGMLIGLLASFVYPFSDLYLFTH